MARSQKEQIGGFFMEVYINYDINGETYYHSIPCHRTQNISKNGIFEMMPTCEAALRMI